MFQLANRQSKLQQLRSMDAPLDLNAWNLIILLGAIHGLIISLLLMLSNKNSTSGNILLTLMLLFYTLPVLRVVLHDIGVIRSLGFTFLSVELLYGLGPSLYLYTRTLADADLRLGKAHLLHFLPVVLELIYYASPFYLRHEFYFFAAPINSDHIIWMVQQAGGIISIFIYLFLTNRILRAYAMWIRENFSETHKRTLDWLRKPVLFYTLFFILWIEMRVIDVGWHDDSLDISYYYPFLALLSLGTYWIGTQGYLQTHIASAGFEHTPKDKVERAENQGEDHELLEAIFRDLESVMEQEKVYLNGELSLTGLAQYLNINPRMLSKVINSQAKVSFYEYINTYRVEAFKKRLKTDQDGLPMINLAYDCGFGSKATFNQAFKNKTGVTPSQYRKRLQDQTR